MTKHEFGIIDFLIKDKWYVEYEPEEYNCTSVNDDLLDEIINKYVEEFTNMKTYAHILTNPMWGLNYCGITLIPPESLGKFCNIITDANNRYQSQELKLLLKKISEAIKEKKYLIHYGI
ncbi:hypothetical protein [Clostridium tagluense]|uniref:Uncharacterized protein n=1 Tax=Clostridium tagluense TaxID=360422 RepID=A0A401ULG1_9CLOT|nr:hypothetical protein [Clostridium tagluense]GCD10374.1 hypothetical protein Ctaglu_19970 [Clostridium tagluense]